MSTRTSQRHLAIAQRQTLKALGYTDREIQTFAQLFTTTDRDDRIVCATDQETTR